MTDAEFIRWRFDLAVVKTDPFPHLVIPNILPPEVYDWATANMPPAWRWWLSALCDTYNSTYQSKHSHYLSLRRAVGAAIKSGIRQPMFALHSGSVTTPMLRKYSDKWTKKIGPYSDLIDQLTGKMFAPLLGRPTVFGWSTMCRRIDWRIPPHVHTEDQAVQSMIYFAPDDKHPELGTILYRVKAGATVPDQGVVTVSADESQLEEVGVLPYLPNTLVAWINTPHSFHASPRTLSPRDYIFSGSVWQ